MTKQQVENELRSEVERALEADGLLVTIHRRNGKTLTHWSGTVEWKDEDTEQSLFKILDDRS